MSWININAKRGEDTQKYVVNMNRVIYIRYEFSPNIDAVFFYFTKNERLGFSKADSKAGLEIDDKGMVELIGALGKLGIPTEV